MKGMDGRMFVVLAIGLGVGWGCCWLHLQPQLRRLRGRVAALRRRMKRLATERLPRRNNVLPLPGRAHGA